MAEKKASVKSSSSVKILKCICDHDYQDQKYGRGMRVMNHAPVKGAKPNNYRCTVCKRESTG